MYTTTQFPKCKRLEDLFSEYVWIPSNPSKVDKKPHGYIFIALHHVDLYKGKFRLLYGKPNLILQEWIRSQMEFMREGSIELVEIDNSIRVFWNADKILGSKYLASISVESLDCIPE